MKHFPALFAIAFAALLCSCDAVISKTPVADSTESPLQEKLEGTWYREGRSLQVAFDDEGVGFMASLEWRDGDFEMTKAMLNAIEVEGQHYLSLMPLDEEEEAPGHMISALSFPGENEIQILVPDLKKVEQLIADGKLKGTINKERYSTTILLEDAKGLIETARPVDEFFKTEEDMSLHRLPEKE